MLDMKVNLVLHNLQCELIFNCLTLQTDNERYLCIISTISWGCDLIVIQFCTMNHQIPVNYVRDNARQGVHSGTLLWLQPEAES